MQKPNVLFISSWYPSKEHETLGNFVQRHAEAINPFVNLFVVYVTSSEQISSKFEIEHKQINQVNTTIVYYKKVEKKIGGIDSIIKLKRYREGYQRGVDFVEKKCNISQWDITHCNVTFPAGIIAQDLKFKRKIPYVLTEHWTLFLPYKDDFEKLKIFVKNKMKKIVRQAERVLPVSEHLGKSMREKDLRGNYQVIPNVVDTSMFEVGMETNNKVKKILHVSTLIDDHKNISGIFRVLNEISKTRTDFNLVVVSDGDIEKAKQLQSEIGLDKELVNYFGTQTPKEISAFYRQSDFFILFSNYENLPVVISESFCCGLPVVSSSVGGIPEMINKGNGMLVEPQDEIGLKKAINSMLDTLHTYSKSSIREEAIKRYDSNIVGNQFYELYKEILSD